MRCISIFGLILFSMFMTGITFADVFVNLPDTSGFPNDTLQVPVKISDVTGLEIYSYQFKMKYDSSIVKAIGVDSSGTLTEKWGTSWLNVKAAGEITIGNYGVTALEKPGILIYVLFKLSGKIDHSTTLKFSTFEFNAGKPTVLTKNGSLKILHPPVSVKFSTNVIGEIEISIDGVLRQLPFDTTWYYQSTHTISTISPQYKTNDFRLVFDRWSDNGDTIHAVQPVSDTTFTLYMKEQYLLKVQSDYGTVSGTGWYDQGKNATFSVDSLLQQEDSLRHVFKMWQGTGNGSYTGPQRVKTIEMNYPIIETAKWGLQYALKIKSPYGNPNGQGWYEQGDTAIISIDSLVSQVEGTRYVFDSWSGKGTSSYSGIKRTVRVLVFAPVIEQAVWKTEHYLWLTSEPQGITQFKNSGWYGKNKTAVTDTATWKVTIPDYIYKFQSWNIDGKVYNQNPTQVLMDTSHTAIAVYKTDSVRVTITTNIGIGTHVNVDDVKYLVPYSKYWAFQSEHQVSVPQFQSGSHPMTRYNFSSWSNKGQRTNMVKADSCFQLTAYLSTQYYLSVVTYPSGLISFAEMGWYDQGNTVHLTEAPLQIITSQDTLSFKGWFVDKMLISGNPIDLIMNKYHNATALYKDLYYITGQIIDRRGKLVPDIKVVLSGASQDTFVISNDKNYYFNFLKEDNFEITPLKEGVRFDPPTRKYQPLRSNLSDQDFFAIDTLKPMISLIYPNGGEKLKGVTVDTIRWQAEDNTGIDSIGIDLSFDNGIRWQAVAKIQPLKGNHYLWTVPDITCLTCKIRVTAIDLDGNKALDVSDSPFTIISSLNVTDNLTDNFPTKFEVQQNYPNPFNSSTIIAFQIPEACLVAVRIFNVLGQEIITLLDTKLNAGHYTIHWDGNDHSRKLVSSGVYFYQVEARDKISIRKLLYIR